MIYKTCEGIFMINQKQLGKKPMFLDEMNEYLQTKRKRFA